MNRITSILVSWVFMLPVGVKAQVTEKTMSVSDAVESVRAGRVSVGADLLANKGGGVSGAERQAFADSLVVIATSYRSEDPGSALGAATAALTVIELAADASRGTPFPRAFETLVRIYQGSPEVRIRGTVLSLIGSLSSHGRAVQFLSEVAVTPGGAMPSIAVRTLAQKTGQSGLDELRRLYEAQSVVNSRAREILDAMARRHGWGF